MKASAIFFMSSLFNFFTNSLIPKNNARNKTPNIASDVCVNVTADSSNPISRYDFLISILMMLQNSNTRNDCDKIEGQWPHRKPVDMGDEKINNDRGSESTAIALLKSLIIRYITKAEITAKKTTVKYIES